MHEIPARGDEPRHWHLDVRYLLVGNGDPCEGAQWYPLGEAGDESVDRLGREGAQSSEARLRAE